MLKEHLHPSLRSEVQMLAGNRRISQEVKKDKERSTTKLLERPSLRIPVRSTAKRPGLVRRVSALAADFYRHKEQRELEDKAVQERKEFERNWETQLLSGEAEGLGHEQLLHMMTQADFEPRLRLRAALQLAKVLVRDGFEEKSRAVLEFEGEIRKESSLLLADYPAAMDLAALMGQKLNKHSLEDFIYAELEKEALRLPANKSNPYRFMLIDLADRRLPRDDRDVKQMRRALRDVSQTIELAKQTFQSQPAEEDDEDDLGAQYTQSEKMVRLPSKQPDKMVRTTSKPITQAPGQTQRMPSHAASLQRMPSHSAMRQPSNTRLAMSAPESAAAPLDDSWRHRLLQEPTSPEGASSDESPRAPNGADSSAIQEVIRKRMQRAKYLDVRTGQKLWDHALAVPLEERDPRCTSKHFGWRFDSEPPVPDGSLRVRYSQPCELMRPLPAGHRHCRCSRGPCAWQPRGGAPRESCDSQDSNDADIVPTGEFKQICAMMDRSLNVSGAMISMGWDPTLEEADVMKRVSSDGSNFDVHLGELAECIDELQGETTDRIRAKAFEARDMVKARRFKVNVVETSQEEEESSSEEDEAGTSSTPPRLGSKDISGMTLQRLRSLDTRLMSPRGSGAQPSMKRWQTMPV